MGPDTTSWRQDMATSRDTSHIPKFDGTNFPSWKFGIWMLLERHRLTEVVLGDTKKGN